MISKMNHQPGENVRVSLTAVLTDFICAVEVCHIMPRNDLRHAWLSAGLQQQHMNAIRHSPHRVRKRLHMYRNYSQFSLWFT